MAYREEITANFKKREDKFILNTVPNKYDLDEILNFSVGVKFGRQSWACKKKVVLKLSVAVYVRRYCTYHINVIANLANLNPKKRILKFSYFRLSID